jgi:hypothetical protein
MKITTIDRVTLKQLAEEITQALKPIADKYEIFIRYKGGSFIAENATLKLEIATVRASGQAETETRINFKTYAGMFGLKPEYLDKAVKISGKNYTIAGLKPSARRSPVIILRDDGKRFKIDVNSVKSALGEKIISDNEIIDRMLGPN